MSQIEYQFSLKLRVDSPGQLWRAAAARCLTLPGICKEDVADMIGPIDDPSISDCLMVLTLPDEVPGCTRLDADLYSDEVATVWKDAGFSTEWPNDCQSNH